MAEQGSQEAYNEEAWERYIEAERRELEMRRKGLLAKMLGIPIPDESLTERQARSPLHPPSPGPIDPAEQ